MKKKVLHLPSSSRKRLARVPKSQPGTGVKAPVSGFFFFRQSPLLYGAATESCPEVNLAMWLPFLPAGARSPPPHARRQAICGFTTLGHLDGRSPRAGIPAVLQVMRAACCRCGCWYSEMKKATNNPENSVQLLNEFYTIARERFAPGTPGRLSLICLINEIHDDVCDGKQPTCARCAEFTAEAEWR